MLKLCHDLDLDRIMLNVELIQAIFIHYLMLKFQVDYVSTDTCNKIWMCLNCYVILKIGKVPGQAKNNNLDLRLIPKENCLNSVETREGFLRKNIVAVSFFPNCAIHQYS